MAASYCQGTITGADAENFDAQDAAQRLRKAMKGLGTDERQIIKVLVEHNNAQRQDIKATYKTAFGRDLVEDLESELSGPFEKLCIYLLKPARTFDAFCLYKAMKGFGTKEDRLIDILASKTNSEMAEIKEEFSKLYEADLEATVRDETSFDFQRILVSLLQGRRSEEQTVDEDVANKDMRALYDGGVGKRDGTDEDEFVRVIGSTSIPHARRVFQLYKDYGEKDIRDAIRGEMSGDTQKAFLALVDYIENPLTLYARRLFECMDGPGTDDERLIQLMVAHSEVDLKDIEDEYEKHKDEFKMSLKEAIKCDTSGDYRKLLVAMLEGTPSKKADVDYMTQQST